MNSRELTVRIFGRTANAHVGRLDTRRGGGHLEIQNMFHRDSDSVFRALCTNWLTYSMVNSSCRHLLCAARVVIKSTPTTGIGL